MNKENLELAEEHIKLAEELVVKAMAYPFKTILENAGIVCDELPSKVNQGYNAKNGAVVDMFEAGILDPVLVTRSALKNAASVASTILSTNCVMSNLRG